MLQIQDTSTLAHGYNPYANYAQLPGAANGDNQYAAAYGYDPYAAAYGVDPYAIVVATAFDPYAAAPAYSYTTDPTADPLAQADLSYAPLAGYGYDPYAAAIYNSYLSLWSYAHYLAAAYGYNPYALATVPPYWNALYNPYALAAYADPYTAASYGYDPYGLASYGTTVDATDAYTLAAADPYGTAVPYKYALDSPAISEVPVADAGYVTYCGTYAQALDPYLLPSQSSARIASSDVSRAALSPPAEAEMPTDVALHSDFVKITTIATSAKA